MRSDHGVVSIVLRIKCNYYIVFWASWLSGTLLEWHLGGARFESRADTAYREVFHALLPSLRENTKITLRLRLSSSLFANYASIRGLDTVWNRDSSDGIVTGHGMNGRGSIPCRSKIFLFSTDSRSVLVPTQWVPGVKWPGCEADHSHTPKRCGLLDMTFN
jgi:hypothetical protein